MQDTKYHIITTLSTLFVSYILAISINQISRYVLTPVDTSFLKSVTSTQKALPRKEYLSFEKNIEGKGFFKELIETPESATGPAVAAPPQEVSNLTLTGTITGPASIARAYIKKRGEREGKLFRLNSNVHGYKLHKIKNFEVQLKSGDQIITLDMYAEEKKPGRPSRRMSPEMSSGSKKSGNISRAELMQNLKGQGMDALLKGLRVGPYRVNGKIEGFKLFKVQPNNILYKLGARSGDIIKRINGQPATSSSELFKMWQSLPTESKAIIHIKRGNKLLELNYTISD